MTMGKGPSGQPLRQLSIRLFAGALAMISIILKRHSTETIKNLERLVQERTRELDQQKRFNLQTSKMSALGEVAGGIAHEINTPLASIKLLSSQALHELNAQIPDLEKLACQIQKIEHTADRVARTIKSLKTFARDGSSDPLTKCFAQEILNETIELCSEQLRAHNITLKINTPQKGIPLRCRPIQISQVLLNLILNARDAIIDLPDKWIEISIKEDETWVEFRITDSGKGIPKENQEKIFQPFFTTKPIGKGTGMGLSISMDLIKAHGGSLGVDTKSRNTCFVLKLRHSHSQAPEPSH